MPAVTPRNPALERQIVEAPEDPLPRQVYGDWLQSIGDRSGEWIALAMGGASREVRLDYLAAHRDELLGQGAEILTNGWIGWEHGFAGEVRLQAVQNARKRLATVLERPLGRFVRCVSIGRTPSPEEAVRALVDAAPPLLTEVLAIDDYEQGQWRFDALAELPGLRKLGLFGATIDAVMPQLTELAIYVPSTAALWVARGACPHVEVLTLHCHIEPTPLPGIIQALPALKAIRVVNAQRQERVLAELAPWRNKLDIEIVANAEPWLSALIAERGRDAVRLVPSAGGYLANAAHGRSGSAAIAHLEAAMTLPTPTRTERTWQRAALAMVSEGRYDDAVYLVREARALHAMNDPALHAVSIKALRRRGDLAGAVTAVAEAMQYLPDTLDAFGQSCVMECMLTLGQAAQWRELLEVSARWTGYISDSAKAAMALAHLALGEPKQAKALLEKSHEELVVRARHAIKEKRTDVAAVFAGL